VVKTVGIAIAAVRMPEMAAVAAGELWYLKKSHFLDLHSSVGLEF